MEGTSPEKEHQDEAKSAAPRMIAYLLKRKGLFFLALALTLVTTALSLSGPLILKTLVDSSIPKGDSGEMLLLALAYVAIVGVMGLASYHSTMALARIGLYTVTEIKRSLFARILRLPVAWHDAHPVGELMSRVEGDTERVREFFSNGALSIAANLLFFLGMIAVFLAMDWRTTLIVLSPLPVLGFLAMFFFNKLIAVYEKIRERYAELCARIAEFVQGSEVLRAFRKAGRAVRAVAAFSKAKRDQEIKASLLEYSAMGLIQFITGPLFIAALVGLLSPGILAGAMSLGTLIIFIEYGRRLFEPLFMISENIRGIQQARVSLGRISAVTALPAEGELSPGRLAPRFEESVAFKGLRFAYSGEDWVLDGVDFEIPKGKTVAMVGASGSGKSTAVGLLCGFYRPQEGQVLVDGISMEKLDLGAWRRLTALVLQEVYLFPGSVLENVRIYDDSISRERVRSALEAVGALDFVERLPGGLDAPLGERGGSLSQGEKQLLSFARAMAFDPELIILDEATASVDMASERLIHASMAKLRAGRTALVVAHRLSSIVEADEILFFKSGKIAARGTHAGLLAAHPDYAELVRLQIASGASMEAEGRGRAMAEEEAGASA